MPSYLEPINPMAALDSYYESNARQRRIQAEDRERARADEAENAQRSYADYYRRGDYESAGTVAAKRGDMAGVTAAREGQQQHTDQERREAYRILNQYGQELDDISQSEDPATGYAAWLSRAREQSQASPELAAEVARWPEAYDPGIARRLSGVIRTWRDRILTPEQAARLADEREERDYTRRRQLTPEEVRAAGYRPGTVVQTDGSGQHYVTQDPASGGGGRGSTAYRPITPEEAAQYNLPADGNGYVMGSNGLPRPISGANTNLAGAEQRGRIALSFTNIVEAQRALQQFEDTAAQTGGDDGGQNTPFGRDWGARLLEAVPFDGGSSARLAGGGDYTNYEAAIRTFEQSVMPIFSGSAVTESEAQRFVRANLPRFGDNPDVLRNKAQNRARIVNSAAVILGTAPPYPQAGVWSPSGGLQAPAAAPASSSGFGLESLTDEQLDALEQELTDAGR